MRNPRVVLGVGVLLGALAVVGIVVLLKGSSEGGGDRPRGTVRAKITLERAVQPDSGRPELLVSLPDARINTLDTTQGATSVLLRCVDRSGAVAIRQGWKWPLLEEVGFPPHIHQPALPGVLDRVRGCRLTASGVDFAGRAPGGVPAAR